MFPFADLLELDRQSTQPLYLQVCNGLVKLIQKGQLGPGTRLPGSRVLAAQLQLNRNTVARAIDELAAQGWLELRPKRGAFVATSLPWHQPQQWTDGAMRPLVDTPFNFHVFSHIEPPTAGSALVGFDDGLPDVRLAPIEELARSYARNLRQAAKYFKLGYQDGRGSPKLRKALATMLNETRGLPVRADNLLITRGTVMAIHLAIASCVRPGDRVVVGETNYQTANMLVRHYGGELRTVPVDTDGLRVDALEKRVKRESIRAVYLTSHHHHPTTVTLSPERRLRLLELARQYNFALLEDDYDYDFHYDNRPVLPLASGDARDRTFYFGSFTKVIAPAFRVGFLMGPSAIMPEIPRLRRVFDRQGDPVLENAIADLLLDGTIRRHQKKSWRVYRDRRDHLCHLLDTHLSDWVQYEKPRGGLAVWVHFDDRLPVAALSEHMRRRGYYFSDGQPYQPLSGRVNAVRMGFASMNPTEMERGVELLAGVVKSMVGKR